MHSRKVLDGEGAACVVLCAEGDHYGAATGGIGLSGGINNFFRYK